MTPKEKAEELILKYLRINGDTEWFHKVLAKQCSLIAVDEIIDILSVLPYGMEYLSHIDYWEEVKKEIEKL